MLEMEMLQLPPDVETHSLYCESNGQQDRREPNMIMHGKGSNQR